MEDYVKTFESWLFEEENKKNVMESEIPWATADTKGILEGKISEIDILAQESPSFDKFVEAFSEYAKTNSISIEIDDEIKEWLRTLYDQTKENSDI